MSKDPVEPEGDQFESERRDSGRGVTHSLYGDPTGRVFHSTDEFFDYLQRDREPTEDASDR